MNPPTITVGLNGKSASTNLPSGGDGWEELDISNFPRDFQNGDYVYFETKFDLNPNFPTDWNTKPTAATLQTNDVRRIMFTVKLDSVTTIEYKPIYFDLSIGPVANVMNVYQVFPITNWNSGQTSASALIQFTITAFNGGGHDEESFYLKPNNLTQYVTKAMRKRS